MNWFRTPCEASGCVEVRESLLGFEVRSSERPDQTILATAREWAEFVAAVKAGAFDHLGADGQPISEEQS